jgi:hypothetical protein
VGVQAQAAAADDQKQIDLESERTKTLKMMSMNAQGAVVGFSLTAGTAYIVRAGAHLETKSVKQNGAIERRN